MRKIRQSGSVRGEARTTGFSYPYPASGSLAEKRSAAPDQVVRQKLRSRGKQQSAHAGFIWIESLKK